MQPSHLPRIAAFGGAALLAGLALAGCGGGGNGFGSSSTSSSAPAAAAEAFYIADAGNSNIPVFTLSAAGTPTELGTPSALPGGSSVPADLILDPSHRFVLVANSGGTARLSVYAIQANGGLLATPTQTVALPSLNTLTHSAMVALTTANGEFVYVAGSTVNTISVFQLNTTTGALTTVAAAVPTTGPAATRFPVTLAAYQLVIQGQGASTSQPSLLVGDQTPSVTNYFVNPNGTLSNGNVCQAGEAGPVYVVAPASVTTGNVATDQIYAYDNGTQDLYTCQVSVNGTLTQTASFSGPGTISSFSLFPGGGALYLTQADGPSLYEYTVSATTGVPPTTPTQTTTVTGAQLEGSALDAAGRFIGVVDATSATPRVVVYSLNGKAVGSVVATYPLPADPNPADPVAFASNILGGG